MKLERRIKQLEATLAKHEEQRKLMLFEIFALRAALISTSSDARQTGAKARAMDRLVSYLMAGEYPETDAQEAIAALEDMFYEIDAAPGEADRLPARAS